MASSAVYTKDSIRNMLDSELSVEARRSLLQELIASPDNSALLTEVAASWHRELTDRRLEIMRSNELVRIEDFYIASIRACPRLFRSYERIKTAVGVIEKTQTDTTQKQIAFEKSAQFAETTHNLLDALLAEATQELAARFSP